MVDDAGDGFALGVIEVRCVAGKVTKAPRVRWPQLNPMTTLKTMTRIGRCAQADCEQVAVRVATATPASRELAVARVRLVTESGCA